MAGGVDEGGGGFCEELRTPSGLTQTLVSWAFSGLLEISAPAVLKGLDEDAVALSL